MILYAGDDANSNRYLSSIVAGAHAYQGVILVNGPI